jgi:hypothetical protein
MLSVPVPDLERGMAFSRASEEMLLIIVDNIIL